MSSMQPEYRADFAHPLLDQKTALITGGGTGIGRGLAETFAAQGARVVVMGRRENRLQETVAEIETRGGQACAAAGDVVALNDARRAVDIALDRFGALDVLVNNAGMFMLRGPSDYTVEEYDHQMGVNVKGPFVMMKAALDALKRTSGSILNIGSIAGKRPITGESLYNASKSAIAGLTRAWAAELAEHGVRCNCIHPGVVASEIAQAAGLEPPEDPDAMEQFLASLHPLGRIGEPRDIAAAAVFLSSALASWVTGAELDVDGGMAIGRIEIG